MSGTASPAFPLLVRVLPPAGSAGTRFIEAARAANLDV